MKQTIINYQKHIIDRNGWSFEDNNIQISNLKTND